MMLFYFLSEMVVECQVNVYVFDDDVFYYLMVFVIVVYGVGDWIMGVRSIGYFYLDRCVIVVLWVDYGFFYFDGKFFCIY